MRINIYITVGKSPADKKEIRRLVRQALKDEKETFETVNVILADDAYLAQLNETYFKKKKTTNVISFNLGSTAEIYVSQNRARDTYDLYYYILHGLFHVTGYDHNTESGAALMKRKCQSYLNSE